MKLEIDMLGFRALTGMEYRIPSPSYHCAEVIGFAFACPLIKAIKVENFSRLFRVQFAEK